MKKVDLTGKTFGRIMVVQDVGRSPRKDVMWLCKCKCGNETRLPTRKLLSNETVSCGCFRNDLVKMRQTTHNHSRTPTYTSWNSMINRCTNRKHTSYKNYGARGIQVCDRWLGSFDNFLSDMGERPKGKSLDRIDVNKGYEPNNCKWSTRKEQQRNMRNNIMLEHKGEIKSLPEWCEILNLDYNKARNKFRYKDYTIEELLNKTR